MQAVVLIFVWIKTGAIVEETPFYVSLNTDFKTFKKPIHCCFKMKVASIVLAPQISV